MRFLGIEFAPFCIPIERRLQTLAAWGWVTLMLGGAPFSWFFYLWGIIWSPALRVPFILYAMWMYWDRASVEEGNRRSSWVRNWRWWKYFKAYFPVNLIKTADLRPDKSYLFVTFPHGILSVGPFCAFATDSCKFEQTFPGLTPHTVTLSMHFVTPFIRELGLAMGSLPASEKTLLNVLRRPGKALCLVAGGAEEAFLSRPGRYDILLARRKGFARVALKSGASLVPTIAFGEPDVYDQISCERGTFLRWTQDAYKRLTGIAPVYLKGRGIFQYTWGFLPYRKPITIVAGEPIPVQKVENPSKDEVDQLHEQFTMKIQELYEKEKSNCISESCEFNLLK